MAGGGGGRGDSAGGTGVGAGGGVAQPTAPTTAATKPTRFDQAHAGRCKADHAGAGITRIQPGSRVAAPAAGGVGGEGGSG